MRVLKHAHIGDEQVSLIRGQRERVRIASDGDVADHSAKIVGLEDLAGFIGPDLDARGVDDEYLKAALVDDKEQTAVPTEQQPARKRALEARRRAGGRIERARQRVCR